MQCQNNRMYANFFVRLAAYSLDCVVVAIAVAIVKLIMWAFAKIAGIDFMLEGIWFSYTPIAITGIFLSTAYFVFTTYCFGQTIGKALFQIKVVGEDDKLKFWNVLYRETVGRILHLGMLRVLYIVVAADNKHQGIHDKLADTYVVYAVKTAKKYKTKRVKRVERTEELQTVAGENIMQPQFERTVCLTDRNSQEVPDMSDSSNVPENSVNVENNVPSWYDNNNIQ